MIFRAQAKKAGKREFDSLRTAAKFVLHRIFTTSRSALPESNPALQPFDFEGYFTQWQQKHLRQLIRPRSLNNWSLIHGIRMLNFRFVHSSHYKLSISLGLDALRSYKTARRKGINSPNTSL